MNNQFKSLTGVSLMLAISFFASSAQAANLLSDPGFETQSLNTLPTIVSDFNTYKGIWGAEAASIGGIVGGITPPEGSKMLNEVTDGSYTQTMQIVKLSPTDMALVNSGNAQFNLSALFNTDTNIQAAQASVQLSFYNSPTWVTGDSGSPASAGLTLDNDPYTWQTVSKTGIVPIGTSWLLAQVVYYGNSLQGGSGFVDSANLTITAVPVPAAAWLFGSGLLGLLGMARRKAA